MEIESTKSVVSNNLISFLFHNESTLNERYLMQFQALCFSHSEKIFEDKGNFSPLNDPTKGTSVQKADRIVVKIIGSGIQVPKSISQFTNFSLY